MASSLGTCRLAGWTAAVCLGLVALPRLAWADAALSITDLPPGISPQEVRQLTRVHALPTLGELSDVRLYAAYATVQRSANAHLHFELFEAEEPDAPVVVYLMGGPGVPGFAGWGIMKNMPIAMHPTEPRLVRSEASWGSWTAKAHVLWLDAPVHVGYSFAEPGFFVNCTLCPGRSDDGTTHTLNAVQQVLGRFGLEQQPLHIVGLSYGGKYAPALAWKILHGEDKRLAERLASMTVFGSWTDPENQLPGQVEYFEAGGLVSSEEASALRAKEAQEVRLVRAGRFREANALNGNLTGELLLRTGVAPVDVTLPMEDLEAAMGRMTVVANMPDFKAAMHAGSASSWEIHDNDGPVADALGDEVMSSYFRLLPALLRPPPRRRQPLELVFVNGQLDSTVRAQQVEQMLGRAAAEAGLEGWRAARRQPWRPAPAEPGRSSGAGGTVEGTVRQAGHLHFYTLRGEGHIAGFKRPEAAWAVMREVLASSPPALVLALSPPALRSAGAQRRIYF